MEVRPVTRAPSGAIEGGRAFITLLDPDEVTERLATFLAAREREGRRGRVGESSFSLQVGDDPWSPVLRGRIERIERGTRLVLVAEASRFRHDFGRAVCAAVTVYASVVAAFGLSVTSGLESIRVLVATGGVWAALMGVYHALQMGVSALTRRDLEEVGAALIHRVDARDDGASR